MEKITNAILLGLEKDVAVAAYRLPGKKQEVRCVIQPDREIAKVSIEDLEQYSGFFIAPFDSAGDGKMYFIRPDILVSENGQTSDFEPLNKLPAEEKDDFSIDNHEMSKEEYISRAAYLVEMLKDDALKKIVLSRLINLPHIPEFRITDLFEALQKRYPEAFVFLFHIPGQGTWLGASPETLLSLNEKTAETVALAGTRPVDDMDWTHKEVVEQQIVTDFVKETLENHGVTYQLKGPGTSIAGNLVHLKTTFQFPAKYVTGKAGKLVKDLHPTPAVCGYPKTEAFDLIKVVEKHKRRFYTGFLGPWNLNGTNHLFVNLRCAEVKGEEMNLYVGGGITIASDPEAEWEETVRKSQTLLTIVEKL